MKDYSNYTKEDLIDEIKNLQRRKKYGLNWEIEEENVVKEFKENFLYLKENEKLNISKDDNKPINLIIEGDNYHAVSILNTTHKESIDVIYIDPPYNTGSNDWRYNNDYVDKEHKYRHSAWIQMMFTRLQASKELLKKDGVLICAIDQHEVNRLGLLLEEVFTEHFIYLIPIVHNPRSQQGKNFGITHEYIYFCIPSDEKGSEQELISKKEELEPEWRDFMQGGLSSERHTSKNLFYPIYIKGEEVVDVGKVPSEDFHPKSKIIKKKDLYEVWPIDSKGSEKKWGISYDSFLKSKPKLRAKKTKNGVTIESLITHRLRKSIWLGPTVYYRKSLDKLSKDINKIFLNENNIKKISKETKTIFNKILDSKARYDASEYGTKIIQKILKNEKFDFPKSLYAVYDTIYSIVENKKNAIILDFFAGSGTTGHAVLLMNKNDGGNRKFILNTNNDNNIATKVCYPRIKNVINGVVSDGTKKGDEVSKITNIHSNLRYFKTEFQKKDATDSSKFKLFNNSIEIIKIKEETFNLLKSNKNYSIYKGLKKFTAILFDEEYIDDLKIELAKLKEEVSVYIFSLGNVTFDDEFENINNISKIISYPEPIINEYEHLLKLNK